MRWVWRADMNWCQPCYIFSSLHLITSCFCIPSFCEISSFIASNAFFQWTVILKAIHIHVYGKTLLMIPSTGQDGRAGLLRLTPDQIRIIPLEIVKVHIFVDLANLVRLERKRKEVVPSCSQLDSQRQAAHWSWFCKSITQGGTH